MGPRILSCLSQAIAPCAVRINQEQLLPLRYCVRLARSEPTERRGSIASMIHDFDPVHEDGLHIHRDVLPDIQRDKRLGSTISACYRETVESKSVRFAHFRLGKDVEIRIGRG